MPRTHTRRDEEQAKSLGDMVWDVVWAGEADASQGSSRVPGPEGTDMMTDGMPEVPRPVLCGVAGKGTN